MGEREEERNDYEEENGNGRKEGKGKMKKGGKKWREVEDWMTERETERKKNKVKE